MKAEELLQRYQAGERDFQGIEIRYSGAIQNVDLSRANFSNANLITSGITVDNDTVRITGLS